MTKLILLQTTKPGPSDNRSEALAWYQFFDESALNFAAARFGPFLSAEVPEVPAAPASPSDRQFGVNGTLGTVFLFTPAVNNQLLESTVPYAAPHGAAELSLDDATGIDGQIRKLLESASDREDCPTDMRALAQAYQWHLAGRDFASEKEIAEIDDVLFAVAFPGFVAPAMMERFGDPAVGKLNEAFQRKAGVMDSVPDKFQCCTVNGLF